MFASSSIKISVLLFYRRLSTPSSRAFWYATWVGIWFNILHLIAFGLCLLLECRPTSAYWQSFSVKWIIEGRKYYCADEGKMLPASGGISLLGDLYSTILPMILVHGLQMRVAQKRALYALFGLGFLYVSLHFNLALLTFLASLRLASSVSFIWITQSIAAMTSCGIYISCGFGPSSNSMLQLPRHRLLLSNRSFLDSLSNLSNHTMGCIAVQLLDRKAILVP